MAEIQNELNLPIGTEEAEKLKPANVKIIDVKVEPIGTKGGRKAICFCKHPQKEETIQISAVKYEHNGKLESVGLWINLDSANKLRKNSALVYFLNSVGAKTIGDLKGKDCLTTEDESGYLTFKAY